MRVLWLAGGSSFLHPSWPSTMLSMLERSELCMWCGHHSCTVPVPRWRPVEGLLLWRRSIWHRRGECGACLFRQNLWSTNSTSFRLSLQGHLAPHTTRLTQNVVILKASYTATGTSVPSPEASARRCGRQLQNMHGRRQTSPSTM